MAHHIASTRTYVKIWAALLVLLVLTVVAARLNLGSLNLTVAMTIAIIKALLVIFYFMHVRWSSRVTWVFAGAAFLWLGIMLVLSLGDYATRGAEPGVKVIAPALVPRHQGLPEHNPAIR